MAEFWQPGPLNLITDVPGAQVGHAADTTLKSGTTVFTASTGFRASVDVMGGAPGTHEIDLLTPDRGVDAVDALVLSGGSAFGLAAATGVSELLRRQGRGFRVGPANVPIVPAAILFDLLNGGDREWQDNPYPELGELALEDAQRSGPGAVFELGSVGAGLGATTADLKGGLGSASLVLPGGITVAALVAVNSYGSVTVPGCTRGQFWAAPFEFGTEFGARGVFTEHDVTRLHESRKLRSFEALQNGQGQGTRGKRRKRVQPQQQGNTTIAIVATDALLDKASLKRLAVASQDGMARSIVPSHTPFDGDLVFAASMGERPVEDAAIWLQLGHAASICLSRAIARAVFHASAMPGDILPTWQRVFGSKQGG
ncbi:MAG: peptidase T4 [Gammaproteobacteria bacterium]|nr:MAG: peptidase T4 [Gammaproteobacteria bacterium]